MKTLSDIYIEGYNKWAKLKYGKDYKKLEAHGLIEEANNQACSYLVDWLLSHDNITIISPDFLYQTKYTIKQEYSETYTPKKITKADAKSKLKDGKKTKIVLQPKKDFPRTTSNVPDMQSPEFHGYTPQKTKRRTLK